jgi:molybdenum-dependent DNA-binding transcriptional regulator ModE
LGFCAADFIPKPIQKTKSAANTLILFIENRKLQMSFKYTPNTLKRLEQLFEEARFTVRYEKGNFNSGYCLLEDRRVVVVNRFLNMEGRINALVEILPAIQIKEEELSDELLKWYKQLRNQEVQPPPDKPIQGYMNLD